LEKLSSEMELDKKTKIWLFYFQK